MTRFVRTLRRHTFLTGFSVIALTGAVILGVNHQGDAQANAPAVAQAIPVVTQTLAPQSVRVWSEFSGKLVAVDAAVIHPEVSGRITEVRFKDGQQVKKGDIIYVIDPRPYEAAAAKAEASLSQARTNANFAKTELGRANELIKTQAIAKRIYDERVVASNVAVADIKSAEAQLKQAKLDLEHAYVRAPIDGRVSRAEITVGNLVQAGPNSPVLTSIVASQSVYADFEVDEKTYVQALRAQTKSGADEHTIPVLLTLRGDSEHQYQGTVSSFDNQIDGTSGTIRARAKFDNADGSLMPGMFAAVKMASNIEDNALLVPERAIGTDQNKKFIYVVGEGNKVLYRDVVVGSSVEGGRIITSGIAAGERVIVDGVQHVRPDAVVDPKDVSAAEVSAAKVAMK